MNPELRMLYQEVIIDHGKNPRHFAALEGFTHKLEGFNPLCGDEITLYMRVEDNCIQQAGFTGHGCAISMASASLMCEALEGITLDEASALYQRFRHMVTSSEADFNPENLDKLTVLAGVRTFPSRIKCATLAWHTLEHAMKNETAPVTTE